MKELMPRLYVNVGTQRAFIFGSMSMWSETPGFVHFDGVWPVFSITAVSGGVGLLAKVTRRAHNGWQVAIPRCVEVPCLKRIDSSTTQMACQRMDAQTYRFDFFAAAEKRAYELLLRWGALTQRYRTHLEQTVGIRIHYTPDDE